jgi:hypothetical protein
MARGPNPAKELFWRQQIVDQAASGTSIRGFCFERDLAENSFYAWRRELTRRDEELQLQAGKSESVSRSPQPASAFVPVNVTPIATRPIELVHPSGSLIRLSPGVDWHDVARLFEVLDADREVRQ